jgi:hypothetical protein
LQGALLEGLLVGQDPSENHARNTNCMLIDALFVTPGLVASAGGYSKFNQVAMLDHRLRWANVANKSFLGHNPPDKQPPAVRRINGKVPRSREKYNKLTEKECAKTEHAFPENPAHLKQLQADKANVFDVMWAHQRLLESHI